MILHVRNSFKRSLEVLLLKKAQWSGLHKCQMFISIPTALKMEGHKHQASVGQQTLLVVFQQPVIGNAETNNGCAISVISFMDV